MLKRLLARLDEGRPWTVAALAKEMDTTSEMVLVALDDLVRRGYLRSVGSSCGGSCSSCATSAGCVKDLSPVSRAWVRDVGGSSKTE